MMLKVLMMGNYIFSNNQVFIQLTMLMKSFQADLTLPLNLLLHLIYLKKINV